MMVSDWIIVCRGFLSMPLGIIALMVFILAAVAVVAYRVTSSIEGSLALAGVFTLSFFIMSIMIERDAPPSAVAASVAILAGVGYTTIIRLKNHV